ncbi:MAG TPA: hypothetical protein VKY19_05330 [Ktedonosporobacter sp.]|jgi:hypothetical protein|nr:hypothetical protein [Ktedonosporobacter sp.]
MEQLNVYLERNKGYGPNWRIRRVNGVELTRWWDGPVYHDIDVYCAEEVKRGGWKGAGVDLGERETSVTFWR